MGVTEMREKWLVGLLHIAIGSPSHLKRYAQWMWLLHRCHHLGSNHWEFLLAEKNMQHRDSLPDMSDVPMARALKEEHDSTTDH